MFRILKEFAVARKGTVAIEYGLIAALIVIALVSALLLVVDEVEVLYNGVSTQTSGPKV